MINFIIKAFRSLSFVFLSLILAFFFLTPSSFAQTTKKIYIGNDDHTDYMWTADEATYKSAFLEMLDDYVSQADTTIANGKPSDFQGRFSADGSLWMRTYEQNRTQAQFQHLIDRIKDGHITVPLNTLAMVFGGQPAEAVLRGMYYSGRIERSYNLRFPLALAMENQTLPFGVGTLWAGAGAKYSWKGVCNCATQIHDLGNREKEIYWWTGLDASKILLKWNSLPTNTSGSQEIGGYAEARNPSSIVDYVDTNSTFKSKFPYNVIGVFGYGWDDQQSNTDAFLTTAESKSNSSRRVIVSNETDFFQDFETTYGSSLPSKSVTFGNEWDLFSASVSEYSARIKRAVEKLRTAEAMAALVSLSNPTFMNQYVSARDQAFINLSLFWEHCGGSGGSVGGGPRQTWMKRMISNQDYLDGRDSNNPGFEDYVNKLYNDSLTALTGLIQKSGTNTRFFVFNPLSWERNDVADFSYSGGTPIHVIDVSTGAQVPSQIITKNGSQFIRILASNVPPVGYKVYEVQSGAGQTFTPTVTANAGVIENERYKITVASRGAITSLIDKTRGNREFAKVVNSKAINDLGATTNGTLTVENAGPVSATILATSSSPVSHTSRITLYSGGIDRIDIQNNITQNFTTTQLWGFGFNFPTNPQVNHEEVGAVIRARLSNDATSPGQYSPRSQNARYDYLTLNHFADMTGTDGVGITLSNEDLDFMKLGNSTVTTLDTSTPQFSPVAGGQLGSGEDYSEGQGGATSFLQRFSLQTHDAYNQTNAMKFAMGHQNPLTASAITGGNFYPEKSYSLLTISNPNVLLWALKPAEEGIANGIILRAWNMGGSGTVSFNFPWRDITSAKQTTHIETNLSDLTVNSNSVSSPFNAQEMKTFRFLTTAGSVTPTSGPSATPIPACGPPGDIDCSGHVNFLDLSRLLSRFGQTVPAGTPEDIDGSLKVNSIDLTILLSNFGT